LNFVIPANIVRPLLNNENKTMYSPNKKEQEIILNNQHNIQQETDEKHNNDNYKIGSGLRNIEILLYKFTDPVKRSSVTPVKNSKKKLQNTQLLSNYFDNIIGYTKEINKSI